MLIAKNQTNKKQIKGEVAKQKESLKQAMYQNKGITLIALVITIVVLLILAGVSIAFLTGDNGIITQATEAREKNEIASVKEQAQLDIANWVADQLQKKGDTEVSSDAKVKEILENSNAENSNKYYKELQEDKIITLNGYEVPFSDLYTTREDEVPTGVDYSELTVGDYISNYPVQYDNVSTYNGTGNIPRDEYNGWRILSIDVENKIVRLVSAGVPINYSHYNNSSTSVANLTTSFFNTPITSTSITDYNFYQCGLKNADETAITNINDVKTLFTNNFTDIHGEGETYTDNGNTYTYTAGNPKVQSMTKADLEEVWGSTTVSGTDVSSNDLLAIPCEDPTSEYAVTWLSSASSSGNLWRVTSSGDMGDYSYNGPRGVRLVVTLKSNIKFTPAETNINGTTTWNIAI